MSQTIAKWTCSGQEFTLDTDNVVHGPEGENLRFNQNLVDRAKAKTPGYMPPGSIRGKIRALGLAITDVEFSYDVDDPEEGECY